MMVDDGLAMGDDGGTWWWGMTVQGTRALNERARQGLPRRESGPVSRRIGSVSRLPEPVSMRFGLAIIALAALLASACGPAPAVPDGPGGDGRLQVVTTFSVLKDIVANVAGDNAEIYSMVPMGTDPHEYHPLPLDVQKAADADVLFWNGLDMETGDGWFANLVEVAGKSFDGGHVFELAKGVEPLYLTGGDRPEVNPHAFLSIDAGIIYVQNARDALAAVDPENAETYGANAEAYIARLRALKEKYSEMLGRIPPEERFLVTSERAFQYMAAEYGLQEGYLWEIDTDDQVTPEQMLSLVNFIRENDVPALLVETNVDRRPMEAVSRETGVPIYGEIFSDELGPPGSEGDTYLKMLDYNLRVIYASLTGESPQE